MLNRLTTIGAIAAVLAAAPALAQQNPSEPTQPPAATDQQPMPQTEQPQAESGAAGDLVGKDVVSADGQDLGEVTRVKQGPDGKVDSIYLTVGSTLGIGGKTVEVYSDQFTQTEDGIKLSLTAEAAEALPESKAE